MKTAKKALLLALCAILLVVASVMGTMAYLKAQVEVVNTFTVGRVNISLDETKVDEYGVAVTGDKAGRYPTGNEYKLISGHAYTKDPTVTVEANSEDSYVRMVVTITDLKDLKKACSEPDDDASYFLPENFVNNTWDRDVWKSVYLEEAVDGDSCKYVFEYKSIVNTTDGESETLPALFKEFKMPENATNDEITALDEMEIKIEAYAVQADGFRGDASAAFKAAFPDVFTK